MYTNLSVDWKGLLTLALILATAGLALSLLLFGWIEWRVRRIQIPPGADALTTLRITPLIVVVLLDLLDFSLDFLAAPFAWVILNYLGLKSLRGLTVVESLIPATQFLPTMMVAWIVARLSRPKLG